MALVSTINQTINNGTEGVVQIITTMSSANFLLHAYGDGTSRIDNSFPDALDLSNSSSWVAMKAPVGTHTWIFSRANNNINWRASYSRLGLGIDGTGTIADSPLSASDFNDFFNNGTQGVPGTLFPADSPSGSMRFNVVVSDTSPYSWWAGGWNIGTGEARTLLFADGPTGNSADNAIYVNYGNHRTSLDWDGSKYWLSHTTLTKAKGWMGHSGSNQAWIKHLMMTYQTTDDSYAYPGGAFVNPYNGSDDLIPGVWFSFRSAGGFCFKGVSSMISWVGASKSTGDTFTVSGSDIGRVCMSDIALFWPSGSAALV